MFEMREKHAIHALLLRYPVIDLSIEMNRVAVMGGWDMDLVILWIISKHFFAVLDLNDNKYKKTIDFGAAKIQSACPFAKRFLSIYNE